MSNYTATSTDAKQFVLKEEGNTIGNLQYASWYTLKANAQIKDDDTSYAFLPKGFWGTTIELKKNGEPILSFKMGWNGDIIISSHLDQTEPGYKLKHTGFLKTSYLLQDAAGTTLLTLNPDFKWTKFTCDYTIVSTAEFEALPYSRLLFITSIHCVNYYLHTMSGVTGATI